MCDCNLAAFLSISHVSGVENANLGKRIMAVHIFILRSIRTQQQEQFAEDKL